MLIYFLERFQYTFQRRNHIKYDYSNHGLDHRFGHQAFFIPMSFKKGKKFKDFDTIVTFL
jgi:hypothetical protein